MIARVRPVILDWISSTAMLNVRRSQSRKTGVAPTYWMAWPVDAKVNVVVITSSPSPMPSAINARWSAAVQECNPTACFAPTYAANSCSKRSVFGPLVIHPESRVSSNSAFSSAPINGGAKGRNSVRGGRDASAAVSGIPMFLLIGIWNLPADDRLVDFAHTIGHRALHLIAERSFDFVKVHVVVAQVGRHIRGFHHDVRYRLADEVS